jgi:hypothetical protein
LQAVTDVLREQGHHVRSRPGRSQRHRSYCAPPETCGGCAPPEYGGSQRYAPVDVVPRHWAQQTRTRKVARPEASRAQAAQLMANQAVTIVALGVQGREKAESTRCHDPAQLHAGATRWSICTNDGTRQHGATQQSGTPGTLKHTQHTLMSLSSPTAAENDATMTMPAHRRNAHKNTPR